MDARLASLARWRKTLECLLSALNESAGDAAALEQGWAACDRAAAKFRELHEAAGDLPDDVRAAMEDIQRLTAVAQGLAVRCREALVTELDSLGAKKRRLHAAAGASQAGTGGLRFDVEG